MRKRKNKMRIKCPTCQHKATIYSRSMVSNELSNVYARCKNAQCKRFEQTFVTSVAFAHWINPSAASLQIALDFMLDQMPAGARREFLQRHSA